MAILNADMFGSFKGKLGRVVASRWKKTHTLRTKGEPSSKAPTFKQLVHRSKFALAVKFSNSMAGLLAITFKDPEGKLTSPNVATSELMKEGILGSYPALVIDYPNTLVAKGSLPNAIAPTASTSGGGIITFHWTDNSGISKARPEDQAILVAHSPILSLTDYMLQTARRDATTATLNAARLQGSLVHTWIAFQSESGQVSLSSYTGSFVVA